MAESVHKLLRFGVYEMNLDTQELRNAGTLVKLSPQPFALLATLARHSGQIVAREDIKKQLWGQDTYVDFDQGVNKCINQIRNVLNDNAERPLYIETLPRKGYRFLAPVQSKTVPAPPPKVMESPSDATERLRSIVARRLQSASRSATASSPSPSAAAALVVDSAPVTVKPSTELAQVAAQLTRTPDSTSKSPFAKWALAVSCVLLAVVGGLYLLHRNRQHLTNKDIIVIADFTNSTDDSVFDDTLKAALLVALNQSPFLNVLPESKVASTLKLMTRPKDTRLTPEIAQELCLRTNSKAYVAGSIARLGTQYVLELKAVDCESGDPLAEEQVTAEGKERVLGALGVATAKLRGKLGESLATVQKFDVPLEQATTSSLEALRAYSLANRANREEGFAAAMPYAQRAIQLDPNFAVAYHRLGVSYHNLGQSQKARDSITKAFQLRERASERERLTISGLYYQAATGELDKTAQVFQEMIDDYPRDFLGYQDLSVAYGSLGRYDKAIEVARQAGQFPPDRIGEEDNLINFLLASQQLEQARVVIQEAKRRNLDSYFTHSALYALGFLTSDRSIMAQQQHWFTSNGVVENFGLSLAADTEAYAGHLRAARELTERAVDSAVRADNIEEAAVWRENDALREAAFGNVRAAQEAAGAGLKLNPNSVMVQVEAGLALAMCGNAAQAESIVKDLNENYPLDTQVQSLWLPAIRAQLALSHEHAAEAANQLQSASPPIEYGASPSILQNTCLYPTYIRGQAYLQSGQGAAAAAEFQRILDHSGMVWNCWTGALARLGVARANSLLADRSKGAEADAAIVRAAAGYEDFLTLWKDADPNVPIYHRAKAEYAKLH